MRVHVDKSVDLVDYFQKKLKKTTVDDNSFRIYFLQGRLQEY